MFVHIGNCNVQSNLSGVQFKPYKGMRIGMKT